MSGLPEAIYERLDEALPVRFQLAIHRRSGWITRLNGPDDS